MKKRTKWILILVVVVLLSPIVSAMTASRIEETNLAKDLDAVINIVWVAALILSIYKLKIHWKD